jgi:acetolactate synthase small subunit
MVECRVLVDIKRNKAFVQIKDTHGKKQLVQVIATNDVFRRARAAVEAINRRRAAAGNAKDER